MSHNLPLPKPDQDPPARAPSPRQLPGMPPDDPIPPEMAPDEDMPTLPRPAPPR